MVRVLTFTLISLLTFTSYAETTLDAGVDRTKIYENDTFTLRITGNVDMGFIGGLMNFGRNQIESPKIEGLENDFEILDQQQSYNMQSINGDTKTQVTWTYSLAPKHSGILTIPKARYKQAESSEITINVVKGKAAKDANNPPNVFMEVEVDKSDIYVQEQVLYTLRLYTLGRLASGNLSVPESNDAIIEAFGDNKKYYRMAYNNRYEVVERKYLIFPQKSGDLTIDSQGFNGLLIDSQNRRRQHIREKSDAITLHVKAPPKSFTGDTWLPASSFKIDDTWQGDLSKLVVGDSVTRNIKMTALGLLGSALPPIKMAQQEGIKIYPDKPISESFQHKSGVQSTLSESVAIVAISAKQVTLPEIRIPWWDTVNNIAKVAVIPEKKISIQVNPETQALMPSPKSPNNPEKMSVTNSTPLPTTDNDENKVNQRAELPEVTQNNHIWYSVIALLVLAWIATTLFLLKRLKLQSKSTLKDSTFKTVIDNDEYLKLLLQAIKSNHPDMTKYLIRWAQSLSEVTSHSTQILSINDLSKIDEILYTQAKAFEEQLYSKNSDATSSNKGHYDSENLLQILKTLSKLKNKQTKEPALRPFYKS